MTRLTTGALFILLVIFICLSVCVDEAWADVKSAAEWTFDPGERLARLERVTQGRLTNVNQTADFSSRFAHQFVQDEQGFMWIGTSNGLDRYDGYSVRNYRRNPDIENSLSYNDVRTLDAAPNGIMWAGGRAAGIDRFDSKTGHAINFRNLPGDARDIGDDHVSDVFASKGGDVWVGTRVGGLARIDSVTLEVTRFHTRGEGIHRIPDNNVNVIFIDHDGRVWVGTDGGLIVASDSDAGFEPVNLSVDGIADSIVVWAIQQDSRGVLYLLTEEGRVLEVRSDSNNALSARALSSDLSGTNDPNSLMMDSNDLLWIVGPTNQVYDTIIGQWKNVDINGVSPFEDRSGSIWFSTQPDVARLDPDVLGFGDIREELASNAGASLGNPFAVLEASDGSVWLSDEFGVWRRHPDSMEFSHYALQLKNDGVSFIDTNALYEDRNGIIWSGTFSAGINRIDPVSGEIKNYPLCEFNPDGELCNRVWVINGDDHGKLWVGSGSGLFMFDSDTDNFRSVDVSSVAARRMVEGGVRDVAIGKGNELWIGTEKGLLQWRRGSDEWIAFNHDSASNEGLLSNFIHSLHVDGDGILWIATQLGANRLDPATGRFEQFNTSNGLPNDDIQRIVEDAYGTIWMSTSAGLASLNRDTREIQTLDASDGLTHDEFLTRSGFAGKSGNIYFGGYDTLLYFDPAMLSINLEPPQVVLTELRINNEVVVPDTTTPDSILQAPINMTSAITLPYQRASMSVEFAGIHFARPQQNRYAYQLLGYDSDWIYADSNQRAALYSNLPIGDYILRVKAANPDGIWDEVGQSLSVTILAPFWRTSWAYLLYVIATIVAMLLVIELRTRTLNARAADLENSVAERTRKIHEHERLIQSQADDVTKLLGLKDKFFTNISHEFRTPLTLILGPANRLLKSDVTDKQTAHLSLIKQNAQRLLRLVDQLLNLSRLDAEEPIDLSPQSISDAVGVVVESFRHLAKSRQVMFEADVVEDLWISASSDALERILMNLLSNAFKYTPKRGDINVVLGSENGQVRLMISDSGIGIPQAQHESVFDRFSRADDTGENMPGAGIGLALVKDIVESLNGSIDLHSSPGEGTTITVVLNRLSSPEPESPLMSSLELSESAVAEIESLIESGHVHDQPSNNHDEGGSSVLIIEDNPDMQDYLFELLSPSYSCLVAGDGKAGIDLAYEEIPDLVLCDVMLPKMDGYKVSQALKSDDRSSHIPIIMLTAKGDRDSRILGLREKVDDYMAKPFNDEELLLRISNILDARLVLRQRISEQIFGRSNTDAGVSARDRKTIEKLNQLIEDNLQNPEFDIGAMSSGVAMSERALQRKLRALTGQTPTQYVRKYRLTKSLAYLRDGMPVNRAAELVGFSSPAYFTSRFREEFGDSPTNFVSRSS
jgi:signal transduction histidine kinase/ligand-binding sensor domain-containing protein/DNA-binding response OmpR family regulator